MKEKVNLIIKQAKDNDTYEQLLTTVQEYKKITTAGIPNSCILSKYHERLLRAQKEYEKMMY
ncbi:MAG: hypothetical protein K6F72_05775 [Bacteroidales bacterium]|nr:hypothetical protein [Bacteroidales bacterium]